jgi:ribonuclease T2
MRWPLLAGFVAITSLAACEAEIPVDHYVLALSWQPAFCERNAGKPECRELDGGDFAATNLSLHGLWPNAADGEHPFYCGDAAGSRDADEAGNWCALPETGADQATQSDLAQVMPGSMSCLDRHEWIKHGTCTGLGGDAYFDASVRLVREMQTTQLSDVLRASIGREVARRDMLAAFERDFGAGAADALELVCRRDGQRAYLAEVRLALRRDAINKPLSGNTLFLDGPPPHGGCPAKIYLDPAG